MPEQMATTVGPYGHCARCGITATIQARAEKLCGQCFVAYVKTKVIKKMETFRVRNSGAGERRRLLLPMSFGVSSSVLLHVLDQHIERQINRTGRPGFDLHVLHLLDGQAANVQAKLDGLRNRYPRYDYSFASYAQDDNAKAADIEPASASNPVPDALPSATSRADMIQIQRSKRIAEEARLLGCESVLWGHTTTALAERVLAESAKGRGSALPYVIHDGPSPFAVNFMYPLRDLLRKEIQSFCKMTDPPLSDLYHEPDLKRVQVSSKGTTIDSLMKDYFTSAEKSFPSIVANVVRTSGKLTTRESIGERRCRICSVPVELERTDLAAWAGNQSISTPSDASRPSDQTCYGCNRSFPEL